MEISSAPIFQRKRKITSFKSFKEWLKSEGGTIALNEALKLSETLPVSLQKEKKNLLTQLQKRLLIAPNGMEAVGAFTKKKRMIAGRMKIIRKHHIGKINVMSGQIND